MGDPAGREGVGQGADHRLLPDQVLEGARPVFARQHLIGGPVVGMGLDACVGLVRGARGGGHGWGRCDGLGRGGGRTEHVVGVFVAREDLVLFPGRAVEIRVAVRHGRSLTAGQVCSEAILGHLPA